MGGSHYHISLLPVLGPISLPSSYYCGWTLLLLVRSSLLLTFCIPSHLVYLRKSVQQFSLLALVVSFFPLSPGSFHKHTYILFQSWSHSFKHVPHLASRTPHSPGFPPTSLAVLSHSLLLVPPLLNLGPSLGTLLCLYSLSQWFIQSQDCQYHLWADNSLISLSSPVFYPKLQT